MTSPNTIFPGTIMMRRRSVLKMFLTLQSGNTNHKERWSLRWTFFTDWRKYRIFYIIFLDIAWYSLKILYTLYTLVETMEDENHFLASQQSFLKPDRIYDMYIQWAVTLICSTLNSTKLGFQFTSVLSLFGFGVGKRFGLFLYSYFAFNELNNLPLSYYKPCTNLAN